MQNSLGQLLLIGFHGVEPPQELMNLIDDIQLGGIILFKRNIEGEEQLYSLARRVQDHARKRGIPTLFNAVDQEGGVVARLSAPFTVFSSQGELPPETTYDDCFRRGAQMAEDLHRAGFNLNLAPVLDVSMPGDVSKNGLRCFSSDPTRVAELGIGLIRGLQEHGIAACAKHFPGLGRAERDPHQSLPTVPGSMGRELIPFRAAVAQDVSCVMMGHALYPDYDPDRQASLSQTLIEEVLRKDLGFQGLVLSDDLEMGAVANQYSLADSVVLSFEAGCDVLLVCSRMEEVADCVKVLSREIEKSSAMKRRLEESLRRVAWAKERIARPGEFHS